jgi:hypothetical protein
MCVSLKLSWAIHHFNDDVLKDLCDINGLDFEEIKERQQNEISFFDKIELGLVNVNEFDLND